MNQIDAADALVYFDTLTGWLDGLPVLQAEEIFTSPGTCALLSVDIINGFCSQGPLASERVAAIVGPAARLMVAAWSLGLRNIVLAQDTHEPGAVEFGAWPAHCVRGTPQSEAVDEFKALPFFDQLTIIPKNSIHAALNTGLGVWLDARPQLRTFVVVGDCTDLCTYQLAMHLRLYANAHQLERRVIVPADCVDTYDFPVEAARAAGALPHPAGIIHPLFLQHMALNGVEVVNSIAGGQAG